MNHPARGSYEQSLVEAAILRRQRMDTPVRRFVQPEAPQSAPVISLAVVNDACIRPYSLRSKKIIAQTIEKHGVSKEALKSRCRSRELVQARQEACFRLRMEANLTFPQISVLIGYEDHTTSLYSFRKYQRRISGGSDGR